MAHNDANDGGDDDHHHLVVMNMTVMNKTSKTWKRSPEGKGKHKLLLPQLQLRLLRRLWILL